MKITLDSTQQKTWTRFEDISIGTVYTGQGWTGARGAPKCVYVKITDTTSLCLHDSNVVEDAAELCVIPLVITAMTIRRVT